MTSIVAISQDDNQECNICCEKYTNHKRKSILPEFRKVTPNTNYGLNHKMKTEGMEPNIIK